MQQEQFPANLPPNIHMQEILKPDEEKKDPVIQTKSKKKHWPIKLII